MTETTKQNSQPAKKPLRFALVGVFNTVLDFAILNGLTILGLPRIGANTISTGIAMVSSFFMNKKWTFDSKSKDYARQVVLFIVFTLIGLWVIQNGIIWLLFNFAPHFGLSDLVFMNLAKVFASLFSLTWNYLTYEKFVFTDKKEGGYGQDSY